VSRSWQVTQLRITMVDQMEQIELGASAAQPARIIGEAVHEAVGIRSQLLPKQGNVAKTASQNGTQLAYRHLLAVILGEVAAQHITG
jgi:hypothetical protein